MKAICENKACSGFQKEQDIHWDGGSTLTLLQARKCPLCGNLMTLVSPPEDKTSKLETIGTTTLNSMTPMERKRILKERSTRDFHKNIEARAREMDKNVIPR